MMLIPVAPVFRRGRSWQFPGAGMGREIAISVVPAVKGDDISRRSSGMSGPVVALVVGPVVAL